MGQDAMHALFIKCARTLLQSGIPSQVDRRFCRLPSRCQNMSFSCPRASLSVEESGAIGGFPAFCWLKEEKRTWKPGHSMLTTMSGVRGR